MGGSLKGAPSTNTADVIIIGAGIAGLAAAQKLSSCGLSVILIEARDRVGGRIWSTATTSGIPIDLGAQWIHGNKGGNPIYDLAQRLKLPTVVTDFYDIDCYTDIGRRVTSFEKLAGLYHLFFFDRAIAAGQSALKGKEDVPLKAIVDGYFRRKAFSGGRLARAKYHLNMLVEHDCGADAASLSATHFDNDVQHPGDHVILPEGYSAICEHLAEGLDVRLEYTVTQVSGTGAGVEVTAADGTVFHGKHAVITLPLGVLKKGSVTFQPPLSARKTQAVQNLGFCIFDKVILVFEKCFWDEKAAMAGYISSTEKGAWASLLNLQSCMGKPALVACNAGAFAERLQSLSDTEIRAEAVSTLRIMYGDKFCEPIEVVVTRWGADPFSRGAYSYVAFGSTPADFDALAEAQGRVHFAGEACIREYYATVHGAYYSGQRAAAEILGEEYVLPVPKEQGVLWPGLVDMLPHRWVVVPVTLACMAVALHFMLPETQMFWT